jgi:hypothetical protein
MIKIRDIENQIYVLKIQFGWAIRIPISKASKTKERARYIYISPRK